jgi:hypothetical protein
MTLIIHIKSNWLLSKLYASKHSYKISPRLTLKIFSPPQNAKFLGFRPCVVVKLNF